MTPELMALAFSVSLNMALCGMFCYYIHVSGKERAEWEKERAELLNRIMARDYNEYKKLSSPGTGTTVKNPVKDRWFEHERNKLREQEQEPE